MSPQSNSSSRSGSPSGQSFHSSRNRSMGSSTPRSRSSSRSGSHSRRGSYSSLNRSMSSINSQSLSSYRSDSASRYSSHSTSSGKNVHYKCIPWIVFDSIDNATVLEKILSEVKATNEHLSKKLEKLEEKVAKLQQGPPAKKKKMTPSREVRVCNFKFPLQIWCFIPLCRR